MNTIEINSLLFSNPVVSRRFIGTFPADRLPDQTPSEYGLVVNTQTSVEEGEHWQSIYAIGDQLTFFDSYGRAPPEGHILNFCLRSPHIYYNAMTHQSDDEITCAGFHRRPS